MLPSDTHAYYNTADSLALFDFAKLFAIETPVGYLLTPYDPEVEKQLDLGRGFMSKYRSVFRALAK
jgi:hypothetical protein